MKKKLTKYQRGQWPPINGEMRKIIINNHFFLERERGRETDSSFFFVFFIPTFIKRL